MKNKRTVFALLWCAVTMLVLPGCEGGPADDGAPGAEAGQDASTRESPDPASAPVATPAPNQAPALSGEAFLLDNGKRDGVVSTGSGLQYEILASGEGPTPGPTDLVTTHYHGTLIDGRVFDSSMQRGEPIEFPVNRVIPGWTEALQLMQVGDRWKLYIPPQLAYGKRGAGQMIGPDETLIFEVELLGVRPG